MSDDEGMLITWAACDTDSECAIANFRRRGTDRKWRLFAVACCRRIEHLLQDKRLRRAIDVAEEHADGTVADAALIKANKAAEEVYDEIDARRKSKSRDSLRCTAAAVTWCCALPYKNRVVEVSCHAAFQVRHAIGKANSDIYEQAWLLQDVFGGKKPTVKLDPTWLTSTVVALARGIYAERAFERMPILADALQEAGCANKRILEHCRDAKQPHVRGCWVIDLILGKK
jgi:hypothetical protein